MIHNHCVSIAIVEYYNLVTIFNTTKQTYYDHQSALILLLIGIFLVNFLPNRAVVSGMATLPQEM